MANALSSSSSALRKASRHYNGIANHIDSNLESTPLKKVQCMNDLNDSYILLLLMAAKPKSYEEEWEKTMKEEITSIENNDTQDLVDLPSNHEAIGVK